MQIKLLESLKFVWINPGCFKGAAKVGKWWILLNSKDVGRGDMF